ncbi:hypothetical protein EDB84DRAFT_1435250 [Lactarius hengduanensis]|nr:hypothetical protein EDB84DRAFT_1435250 [Lactarius hengduanensis]
MHLNPLAFPLALALAVSASMPTGSGEINAGSGNTRTDHQHIALAALDPIVDAARPCVFRGSYCDPQVPCCARYQYWYGNHRTLAKSKKRLLRWKFDTRVSFDPSQELGEGEKAHEKSPHNKLGTVKRLGQQTWFKN